MSAQLQSLLTYQDSSGMYKFSDENFNSFLASVEKHSGNIETRPLGVVAVIGPKKRLLTDWLIHYYQGQNGNVGTLSSPEFLAATKPEKGLYFWPVLSKYYIESPPEKRVLLILYIQGKSDNVFKLALNMCSQAIVFGEENKETLEKFIADCLDWRKPGRVRVFDACPSGAKNVAPVDAEFFKFLETNPVPIKIAEDSTILRLNTFMPIFKSALNQITSSPSPKMVDEKDSVQTDHGQTKTLENPTNDSKTDKPNSTATTAEDSDDDLPTRGPRPNDTTEPATEPATKPTIPPKDIPTRSPPAIDTALHAKVTATLSEWLSTQKSPWRPKSMLTLINPLKSTENQDYFEELEQMFELVDIFNSELRNMFDNYVCFYGTDDSKQLSNFIGSAWTKTLEDLKQKQFRYHKILLKPCQDACVRLRDIYNAHNNKITNYELSLTSKITEKLMDQFKQSFSKYLKSPNSPEDLHQIFLRLQKSVISIMAISMDYGGKLNHVLTESSNHLAKLMNEEFHKIMWKLNEAALEQKNPLLHAIHLYQNALSAKMYEYPVFFEDNQIIDIHGKTMDQVTSGLKSADDVEAVQRIVYGHCKYILSKRYEQEMLNNLQTMENPKNSNTLCIYLLPDYLRMDTMTGKGMLTVVYNKENIAWCPALCLIDKNETRAGFLAKQIMTKKEGKVPYQGKIYNYIFNSMGDEIYAKNMLIRLFKLLRNHSETTLSLNFARALVIVPGWYNVEYLDRIRIGAKGAGFLETYVVSEEPLIAQEILNSDSHQNGNSDLAVAVEVAPDGVHVEIYGKVLRDLKNIQLFGKAFAGWEYELGWKGHSDVSSNMAGGMNLIDRAYTKAMGFVRESVKARIKYCYLLTEYMEWEAAFNEYFKREENSVVVPNARHEYGVNGAARVSLEPRQVRQVVQDYLRVEISEPNFETKLNKDLNVDKNVQEDRSVGLKVGGESEEVIERKKELVKMCKLIKDKIEGGQVKIRRLLIKNIMETLDRAVEVANNKYASLKELECEETEIEELIAEHNL